MRKLSRGLVFALLLPLACVDVRPWRTQAPPWTQASVEGARDVRVSRDDGSHLVLEEARITTDGQVVGREVDPAGALGGTRTIDLAQVVRLETRRTETGRVLVNAGSITLLAFLVVTALVGAAAYALYG